MLFRSGQENDVPERQGTDHRDDGETNQRALLISLMAVITPSATTVVQLAQLYDEEPVYASTINVMTTIVSIITMPLMVMFYLV